MNTFKTYLGIDPGKTIGYAIITVKRSEGGRPEMLRFMVSQEKRVDCKAFGSRPLEMVKDVDLVAIEDFVGAGHRSKESNYVLKMIGAFEVVAKENDVEVFVQAPAKRRKYLKLAKRLYEQECKGSAPNHGIDALAHCLKAIAIDQDFHPKEFLNSD